MAQVFGCLPRKHEALISNPCTTKKKKKSEVYKFQGDSNGFSTVLFLESLNCD
jgi:hypothetical protein